MPEGEVAAALLPHGEHAQQDVAHVEQRVVRRGQRSEKGEFTQPRARFLTIPVYFSAL